PDECARRDLLAARERCGVWLEPLERRADPDLDAALRELCGRIVAEARRDLREDLRRRVDQDPTLPLVREFGIEAERVADEVVELRERLDACVPGADEDEGQLARTVAGRGRCGRGLEPAQDVVTQLDRVLERLEPERVLLESWDRERP